MQNATLLGTDVLQLRHRVVTAGGAFTVSGTTEGGLTRGLAPQLGQNAAFGGRTSDRHVRHRVNGRGGVTTAVTEGRSLGGGGALGSVEGRRVGEDVTLGRGNTYLPFM